jgi:hypothetical protein
MGIWTCCKSLGGSGFWAQRVDDEKPLLIWDGDLILVCRPYLAPSLELQLSPLVGTSPVPSPYGHTV